MNTKKRIYCVEGALDSFFIPNCVAVGSSNLSMISKMIERKNATLIFDNEPRNREILKIMEKASRHNFSVCVWGSVVILPEHIWTGKDPFTFNFFAPFKIFC